MKSGHQSERERMRCDGALARLKALERAIKAKDIKFVHDYSDKAWIRNFNSEYKG
jgi:hypothetical protein